MSPEAHSAPNQPGWDLLLLASETCQPELCAQLFDDERRTSLPRIHSQRVEEACCAGRLMVSCSCEKASAILRLVVKSLTECLVCNQCVTDQFLEMQQFSKSLILMVPPPGLEPGTS